MRNQKIDQICAKRLKADDFAKPESTRLLTNKEAVVILAIIVAVSLIFGALVSNAYGLAG